MSENTECPRLNYTCADVVKRMSLNSCVFIHYTEPNRIINITSLCSTAIIFCD